jgi:hypothetical protein
MVIDSVVADKAKRDELKAKRDALFAKYLRNPTNSKLAIEIKLIDDQIAELVERSDKLKKSKRPLNPEFEAEPDGFKL